MISILSQMQLFMSTYRLNDDLIIPNADVSFNLSNVTIVLENFCKIVQKEIGSAKYIVYELIKTDRVPNKS